MFLLYAVGLGLLAGGLTGGRPASLGTLPIRWPHLALVGLLLQIVLFTDGVAAVVGELGPVLYVGSTLLVLAAILRNIRIPGIPVVVAGAVSNLAAILANGGYMPASPEAMAALGREAPVLYSNSTVVAQPALALLTDVFAMPAWLPAANVFSIGDVLIGAGIVIVILLAMRRPAQLATVVPAGPADGAAAQ